MASIGPCVGFGTMLLKESCEDAVSTAMELGCQMIDTGEHYGNLDLVGAALKKSERKPFVVLKLSGIPSGDYEGVRARVSGMLSKLGIDRAGCVLIHWPGLCNWDPQDMAPLADPSAFNQKADISTWESFCENVAPGWANMLKLQEEGLTEHVGTSNFYPHHLEELKKQCDDVPFANEIFIDSSNQEQQFVQQMQSAGIKVLAYRPIIYKPFPQQVQQIAERLSVSQQNVVLGWLLKRGICPLVKARGAEHIDENINGSLKTKDLITDEDLANIAEADCGMKFSAEWFAKQWSTHNQVGGQVDEDSVQMLVSMGVDEAKARESLEKCKGNLDAAMEIAFC